MTARQKNPVNVDPLVDVLRSLPDILAGLLESIHFLGRRIATTAIFEFGAEWRHV